jgi:hypothetical protein
MNFYGKVFNNLRSLFIKKGNNQIKFGPAEGETEISLGRGLTLDEATRTISNNLQFTANIEGTTLNINFGELTATTTTKEETE